MIVESFIIGLRKTGTTWLYENYKIEKKLNVSSIVKESGYFLNHSLSKEKYHSLFKKNKDKENINLEIETGIFDSVDNIKKLLNYNQKARVAIILRNPLSYFSSRITHCKRKGELRNNKQNSVKKIFEENTWLIEEYSTDRLEFLKNNFKNFKIFYYEDLENDSVKFYSNITQFLTGDFQSKFLPSIRTKINISRNSKIPFITYCYTNFAKYMRSVGLHLVVNYFRNNPIRKFIEKENKIINKSFEYEQIENYLKSINFKIPKNYI